MSDGDHLRLAAVDGEQTIPIDPNANALAEQLRIFADRIEDGTIATERVVAICEVSGRVKTVCVGPLPTIIDIVGLLDLAKQRFLREAFE